MTVEEFKLFVKHEKPVRIIADDFPQHGFIIDFGNAGTIEVDTDISYGGEFSDISHLEFKYKPHPNQP